MKSSITKKLVMTYSAVLVVFLSITVLLLNITARRSLENTIKNNLYTESAVIEKFYHEQVSFPENEEDEGIERTKYLIKSWFSHIKKLKDVGFSSDIALVIRTDNERLGIFTHGNSKDEANFQLINSDELNDNLKAEPSFFRIAGGEVQYFAVSRPLLENIPESMLKAWIISYTPIHELSRMVQDMNMKAIYAIGISLLISASLAYILSLRISKPIKILKNHAEKIASRNFKARVDINTGDEIESLAHAMNKIAGDLNDYDLYQKRFLQNVSHELKTPVMTVMGYAEGIRDGVIEDKDKALAIIMDECERLQRLINQVLYLSKLETVEEFYSFKSEKLNDILNDIKGKVQTLVDKSGLVLHYSLDRDCRILVDRDKFIQAVLNLISNAVRYANRHIFLETRRMSSYVEISIRDDGPGITQTEMEQIFKRFYKGRKGNTGLGLAITKTIIEKHRGTITASNLENGGAVFKIVIPVEA